jgi:CTP:molybdopterin cytidylyltransferase MocA
LPGDYPLLTAAAFQSLRSAAGAYAGPAGAGVAAYAGGLPGVFIPRFNGKNGHPVLLSPECLAALHGVCKAGSFAEGQPAGGGMTLKDFLLQWNPVYIDVDDEGVLIDLDTPEDYRRIEAKMRAGRDADSQ